MDYLLKNNTMLKHRAWCEVIDTYYESLTQRQRKKMVSLILYEIEQLVDRYMSELSAANISINISGTNIFDFIANLNDFVHNSGYNITRWEYCSRHIDKWKYELYVCTMCQ